MRVLPVRPNHAGRRVAGADAPAERGAGQAGHVRHLCRCNERVHAFLDRPIEGDWPYVWLDATYVKVRRDHHIVSVAIIVAVGVNRT